jgi:starch phosphorylase
MNERQGRLVPTPDKIRLQRVDLDEAATDPASHQSDIAEVKSAILVKLTFAVGKDPARATNRDWFVARALTVRDRIIHRWIAAERM